ncbi:MAG TPA: right-handed parallel beta-helix repeat-containing protein [Bacteroidales bacterium]|jgi:hypothetical protein|nr:right-handed parallel beta-helix repeat-containing protein [Bacteroidales bacterium]
MGFTKKVPLLSRRRFYTIFFPLLFALILGNCNRDMLDPDPDALPGFSTDTITFDTIFTTIGSATLSFKTYNRSKRPLIISSVELAGGDASFFRLNIDGEPQTRLLNLEIPPDDSLFIFVAVTIDPTNINNPVVIKDSVIFNTNGTQQDVKLIAYGQDVHLINGEIIETAVWQNDKPWLIYNSMAVDTGETLTIKEGTQIYFHRNSSLIIWGTLIVEGTNESPVLFVNDRPEEFYDIIPGQWGTLYIDPISKGNRIDHAIIKNSIAGIQIGFPSDFEVPELELTNSQILNVSFAGIYAFGAQLTCYNTVIANSGGPAVALLRGGEYSFYHCTISNNGVVGTSRSTPSVILTNIFNNPELNESGQYEYEPREDDLERADFFNSIIYGSFSHELQLVDNRTNLFNYHFDHSLLKAVQDSIDLLPPANFTSVFLNFDPAFKNDSDRYHLDYSLDTLSAAKDSGSLQLIIDFPFLEQDLNGEFRNADGLPDLGAFERKEE